jgi:hypothetical protein
MPSGAGFRRSDMDSVDQQREILLKSLKELVVAVDSAKWPSPYNVSLVDALGGARAAISMCTEV